MTKRAALSDYQRKALDSGAAAPSRSQRALKRIWDNPLTPGTPSLSPVRAVTTQLKCEGATPEFMAAIRRKAPKPRRVIAPDEPCPISRGTLQQRGQWWSFVSWHAGKQVRWNLHCTCRPEAETRRNQLVQCKTDNERAGLIARWKRQRRAAIRFTPTKTKGT